jgi:tetratricopeptide (TPR) repeat protein
VLSPTAPIAAFAAELAAPTDDPARPLEHICFTVAYNMSEQPAGEHQLRLHPRRPADRPADRRQAPRRPRRAPGRRRVGAMRPAPRPWPEPARRRTRVNGLLDPRGNATSTGSRAALEASENALWRMLSFYGMPLDDLDRAIAADPSWLLPRLMKAGFLLNLTEPGLVGDARTLLDAAEPLVSGANERERGHLAALRKVERGDWQGAADTWGGLVRAGPRDMLALQWALLFDFYRGDAVALRERVAAVLPAWTADDPLTPYLLGHHAFGLEESGRYAEAEASAGRALAANSGVPWAIHAVAHVMEMQGRHEEGSVWMATWRPFWGANNGFAGHLGWHEALFALESLDHAKALALFDLYLRAEATEITLQRLDAASLLWRLALLGADVGDRWQRLVAGWALDDPASPGGSAFNDVHALLALLGAGERERAARWLEASLGSAKPVAVEPRGLAPHRRAADAGPGRLRRRPLRRHAPAARAAARRRRRVRSAAAMRSATWSTRRCSPPPPRAAATPRRAARCSTSARAAAARRRSRPGGPSASTRRDEAFDRRRRLLLRAALPALGLGALAPLAARAAPAVPIADMHSHYGMITRAMRRSGLAEDMRAERVALVAWAMPSDLRWIRATANGVEQAREPEPGSLAAFFAEMLGRMRAYVAESGLKTVLTAADVDACIADGRASCSPRRVPTSSRAGSTASTRCTRRGCAICSSCTTSAIRSATTRPGRRSTAA